MTNTNRTNERTNNTYNNRNRRRATEGARAYTRAKAKRQNIIIATIAIALVAVVSAGFITVGALNVHVKSADTNPTTSVSRTIEAKTTAQNSDQGSQQTATQAPAVQVVDNSQQNDAQDTQQSYTQDVNHQNSSTGDQQAATPTESSDSQQDDGNIKIINGERVYIDTNHPVPDKTGNPDRYYANGKTSYGFDWTYDTDNANFVLRCDYNFDRQQYNFEFYGVTPGTAHITLYYNTSDNTQVPVPLTLTVDDDLNATLG